METRTEKVHYNVQSIISVAVPGVFVHYKRLSTVAVFIISVVDYIT